MHMQGWALSCALHAYLRLRHFLNITGVCLARLTLVSARQLNGQEPRLPLLLGVCADAGQPDGCAEAAVPLIDWRTHMLLGVFAHTYLTYLSPNLASLRWVTEGHQLMRCCMSSAQRIVISKATTTTTCLQTGSEANRHATCDMARWQPTSHQSDTVCTIVLAYLPSVCLHVHCPHWRGPACNRPACNHKLCSMMIMLGTAAHPACGAFLQARTATPGPGRTPWPAAAAVTPSHRQPRWPCWR